MSTIGALGHGDGEFLDGPRQFAVTPDGHVWGADYAARRVQEFTAAGTSVQWFPDPLQPPDPAGLAAARGVAVDRATGDVLMAGNWDQRVQANASWRFTLVPTVTGRTYAVKARALDTFGNVSRARSGSLSAG